MSKKRLAAAVLAVIILGAIGLVCLYVTLGRMTAVMKSRTDLPASSDSISPGDAPVALDSRNGSKLRLTPIGEAQLRQAGVSPQPSGEGDSSKGGAASVAPPGEPPSEKQPRPVLPPR